MNKSSAEIFAVPLDASGLERRKTNRAELVVRVDYQTVDELFSEFARNINEGGHLKATPAAPEPKEKVQPKAKTRTTREPAPVGAAVFSWGRDQPLS